MVRSLAAIIFLAGILCGCTTAGLTADDLVSTVREKKSEDSVKKFEVDRPLSQVTATFKDRANECLDKRITTTSYTQNGGTARGTAVYTPKVVTGKSRTRLTLQAWGIPLAPTGVGKPEPEGYYILVVDAFPAGANKTRVEAYSGNGDSPAFKAIRYWAEGSNLGCPDLKR